NGNIVSEDRTVTEFDKIQLNGKINLMFTAGANQMVRVTSDSNLQPYILTQVNNRVLNISIKNNENLIAQNAPVITLRNPKIYQLKVVGDGKIEGRNIVAEVFSADAEGNNSIRLEGKVQQLNINA